MRGGGLARRFLPGLHPSRGGRSPVVGGGVAPTITVPPVLVWTVAHGSSPTITEGTYTGDAGTWTYDLVRGVTTVLSGVSKATVEAYVSDRATDVGPDWKVTGTITNGSGSDAADSNVVTWDRSSLPLVGGHSGEGLTLADSGTTVDEWDSSFGSISATLTAPTSSQRPAYSATGGVGSRPLVTGDSVDDVLVSAAAENFGSTIEAGYVGSYTSATVNRTVIALVDSSMYLWVSVNGVWYHRASATGPSTGIGGGTVGTPKHASIDAIASGDINARIGGTVTATVAASAGTFNAAIALFARTGAGAHAGGAALQAWYFGPQLTSDQRLDLRALLTYLTGVSS